MADPTYITWNITNWITVILMAAIGMAIIGFAASAIRSNLPKA